jgi:hypothetical protein
MDHDYSVKHHGGAKRAAGQRAVGDMDDESSRGAASDFTGHSVRSSRRHSEASQSGNDEDDGDDSDDASDSEDDEDVDSNSDEGNKVSSSSSAKRTAVVPSKAAAKDQKASKSSQSARKKQKLSGNNAKQQKQAKKRTQRNSSSANLSEHDEIGAAAAASAKSRYLGSLSSSVRSTGNQVPNKSKVTKREPAQCLGPGCVAVAVENSKYCSHECGVRLAKSRLTHYLKTRYETFTQSGPCLADQINVSELERIGVEIGAMHAKLADLERKHRELDELIERARFAKINPSVEVF